MTRTQLAEVGATYGDVQRLLRRRELRRMAPGVYLDHTGTPTWVQRAWIAVLGCQPAALAFDSVWRETRVIHVAVAHARRIQTPRGVVVHRMRHFDDLVDWRRSPPRLRIEEAVLDVAGASRDEFAAIAALSEVVQGRRTTYARIQSALSGRGRMPRGRWLGDVLADLATGANSVLEHEFIVRVERPHGLPSADRQMVARAGVRRVERDVAYPAYGLFVELVGRLFHDDALTWSRDLDRDLAALVHQQATTARLGWQQVIRDSCSTATMLGALLRRGGWDGQLSRCPRCPDLRGGGGALGAPLPPHNSSDTSQTC